MAKMARKSVAKMAKMARKSMARIAKIDGEFFSRHGRPHKPPSPTWETPQPTLPHTGDPTAL